jgi:hypothetical protein
VHPVARRADWYARGVGGAAAREINRIPAVPPNETGQWTGPLVSYGRLKLSLLFTKNGQFEVRWDKKKQIYVRLLPLQDSSPGADEGPYWPEHPDWDDPDEIPF